MQSHAVVLPKPGFYRFLPLLFLLTDQECGTLYPTWFLTGFSPWFFLPVFFQKPKGLILFMNMYVLITVAYSNEIFWMMLKLFFLEKIKTTNFGHPGPPPPPDRSPRGHPTGGTDHTLIRIHHIISEERQRTLIVFKWLLSWV